MKHLVPLFVAAALALSACGASSPALEVNGEALSRSDLFDQLDDLATAAESKSFDTSRARQPEGGYNADFVARVLNIEVQLRVVEQELDQLGLDATQADIDAGAAEVEATIADGQEILAPLLGEFVAKNDLLSAALAETEVPESELMRAYEQNPELWSNVIGRELCASHILHETEADADASLAELDAGADFADVAMRNSTGPTGPDGGDLGCAVEGSYVPEFEAAAYSAEPGEVVGPVETQFGFHVIQVREINDPGFEDVQPQLLQIVAQQRGLFGVLLADVDVDARFGSWDPAQLQILPPVGP